MSGPVGAAPEPSPPAAARLVRTVWLAATLASLAVLLALSVVYAIAWDTDAEQLVGALMATIAPLPVSCIIGLVAATVMCRRQLYVFMAVAMVATVNSTWGWMAIIWRAIRMDAEPGLFILKLLGSHTALGVFLACTGSLLTSPHGQRPLVISRRVLVGALTVLTASVLLLMWSRIWERYTIVLSGGLGAGVVGVALGLLVHGFLVWRVRGRRLRPGESLPAGPALTLDCPRCGQRQVLAAGPVQCRRCRLALLIEIEEPRCACGYLLYRLAGETCPECGAVVKK